MVSTIEKFKNWYAFWQTKLKDLHAFGTLLRQVEKLAHLWHVGMFIGTLASNNEKLPSVWHVGSQTMPVCMACMTRDLANSHTLCENVNVTMKTAINFYDMTTLRYVVIKEKFEQMCVTGPYFV